MNSLYFKNWLRWIILLWVIHFIFRIVFYWFYIEHSSFRELGIVFVLGGWIDIAMILLFNLPLLFLQHGIPSNKMKRKLVLLLAMFILNAPFLALNTLDLAYYNFIGRRSNIDLLDILGGIGKWELGLLKIYWPLLTIFIFCSIFIFRLGISWIAAIDHQKSRMRFSVWILLMVVSVVVIRGVGKRPLMPTTPLLYIAPDLQDVAGNSTLNFIYSIIKKQTHVKKEDYFTSSTLDSLYQIEQSFSKAELKKMNVVVIVMESFSKGFMEKGNPLYADPKFLDSIQKESIWCENAYGSKFESNKGLFSIMTGVPSLLDEPVYYSPYSNLKFKSLGQILKSEGYSTHFFMGTEYDHFGFAKACKIAGIDHYHAADEMNGNNTYDGYWGVYDHLFFDHASTIIKKIPQPFFATIFNVSTHHPFAVPDSFKKKLNLKGLRDDQVSIRYFDKVLSDFFLKLQSMPGYDNTVFVFVADHANPLRLKIPNESPLNLRIPLMVHIPRKKMIGTVSRPVQQADIVPTILDLLGYSKPFEAFGKSILDSSSASLPVIWRKGDQYLAYDNRYLSFFNYNTGEVGAIYDLQTDSMMHHNLVTIETELASIYTQTIRSVIQRYAEFLMRK